mmetsp:Transcript_11467/g.16630  ORF Transcript_11467/g.16630 Transcript_11467/m.16630 type:complete len:107 (+) Transcript_11467:114-434(+)
MSNNNANTPAPGDSNNSGGGSNNDSSGNRSDHRSGNGGNSGNNQNHNRNNSSYGNNNHYYITSGNRNFEGAEPKVGAVLGLRSEKIDRKVPFDFLRRNYIIIWEER